MGLALLLMIWMVSIGARELPGRGGSQTGTVLINPYPLFRAIAILLLIVGAGFVILVVVYRPGSRRSPRDWQARSISLIIAFVLLALASPQLLDLVESLRESVNPIDSESVTETEPGATEPVNDRPGEPVWILALAAGAGLLVIGALGTSRRRAELPPPNEQPTTHLSVALKEVLAELHLSDDPKEVIIGAYALMEQALARDGLPRHQAEAPMEYLQRALTRLNISRASVQRLTDLFTAARFSDHTIGRDMAIEAVAALDDIHREVQPA